MNKNISSIQYNSLNLPSSITYQNGNMASYVYSAAGGKLSVSYQTGTGNTSTQYCGNIIYDNNNLSQVLIDGGYITFSGTTPQYHYYLQDHLGSNRVVVNESGTAEQVTHYYPFGGIIADLSTGQDIQKYKYNGKELDLMHGLNTYDYGARQYFSILGRWDRMDPLCEKYYSLSPYNYCNNNPVKFIDPDGKTIHIQYIDNNGKYQVFSFSGFHGEPSISIPKNKFVSDFMQAYLYNAHGQMNNLIMAATNSKYDIYVVDGTDARLVEELGTQYNPQNGIQIIQWESRKGLRTTDGGYQSPATRLEHEFAHAIDYRNNPSSHRDRRSIGDSQYDNKEERRVITGAESKMARLNHESVRHNHKGNPYDVISSTSTIPVDEQNKKE